MNEIRVQEAVRQERAHTTREQLTPQRTSRADAEFRRDNNRLSGEVRSLQTSNNTLAERLDRARARIGGLETARDVWKTTEAEQKAKIEALQADYDIVVGERNVLKEERDVLADRMKALEKIAQSIQ